MSNVFLTGDHSEIETAILLEKAKQCNLAELPRLGGRYANAVAFTDGRTVYINSDEQLAKILPAYNHGMLKWLLWHEKYHIELKHHNRFNKFLKEARKLDMSGVEHLSHQEVNIIMDILVHDVLSRMFPELVDTAVRNLAQMRNRNSLKYTFKTFTLEEMLEEYARHKRGEDNEEKDKSKEGEPEPSKAEDEPSDKPEESKPSKDRKEPRESDKPADDREDKKHDKGGGASAKEKFKLKDDTPTIGDDSDEDEEESEQDEHDKTDWSKLKDISDEEFIDKEEADFIESQVERLRNRKLKIATLTQTLSGLATTTKTRTYAVPSYMNVSPGIILKGRRPGKTALYLVFDASGSMSGALNTFKEIISKSIPHVMHMPCEWFSGYNSPIEPYKEVEREGYYKGTFQDIMPVQASSGFSDDGDRVIELCLKAEEQGYSPIGVTDGGGRIRRPATLKKLKRTILVGPNHDWLEDAKKINPAVQILDI